MKYNFKHFDEEEFLKTVYGMLKYAQNNNAGKVELKRFASSLGKSYELLKLLFTIFEETKIIEIKEKNPDFYTIKITGNMNPADILHNKKYQTLLDLIEECDIFQKRLLEDNLEEIVTI